ncbi:helix-turn-helix transcriptional regulator [Pseudonocardia sp. KRD-184]|uniref:Helix-turn-helix transcriptional regulator n=1 Tax=Pseudonocardia oceani TaxID=2792013 RepID=A0ABS6U9W6_9PSEU|nr:AraC family transcriptional regulator [Pseudonocardia oceani]MBW0090475.1 helix-turn-helix transcriptional regulator [Pseudonocardia oceani]MBW0097679.1 helix-turn-helix transcriptional regulator [Pseudonocardia oceani]MBW0110228.1 helix-turn-helix transcriptional regulator [Pseudonocardia oceani]MBW0124351.1 helix-turn-helix transcriptional regulator [Pseudonocardia oceani]MBW0129042.1 helix-turn-helix transcriptional regulator [Pseudonocardia oceani]
MTRVDAMTFALPRPDLLRARAEASSFDLHLHSTCSVVALRSGAAEVRSRWWSGTARAGEVFVVRPFEVHAGTSIDESTEYEILYPSAGFVAGCVPAITTQVVSPRVESRDLIEALSTPGADGASIEACLRALLQTCAAPVEPPTPTDGSVARAARSLIEENCTRTIRTEDLAREIGVHASHLARAFTGATGVAPQTYARQVRVAKARELICAGVGLSEVAQVLGFSDQPHLTREFKKVYGVPPGALARSVGPRSA